VRVALGRRTRAPAAVHCRLGGNGGWAVEGVMDGRYLGAEVGHARAADRLGRDGWAEGPWELRKRLAMAPVGRGCTDTAKGSW
jgi:hypothetical protein